MNNQMMEAFTGALIPQLINLFSKFWWLIPALIFAAIIKSAWFKGIFGEWIVNLILTKSFKRPEYTLFKDVMIPTDDGTTQIDHILLSSFGIFVIETKNMKGWIFGKESSSYWTQQIFKNKFKFQNPLKQNYKHTKTLSDLLDISPTVVHSIIVFSGNSTFKTPMPDNVIRPLNLRGYISNFNTHVLNKDRLVEAQKKLEQGKLENTFLNKRKHITHVKKLKNNTSLPINTFKECPRCRSKLVLRTAKKGNKQGRQFYGCSNFPKCRFIRDC